MPSQGRAVAAVSVALVLTVAVCYISFTAKGSETPTELIIEGKDGLPEAPGAGAELSAYSQILSFGPASDPAARTTPGDDQV